MQKIVVENFGPIKYAEIELRDFVVLIGEQASGKSTLARLVFFFKYLTRKFFYEREASQSLDKGVLKRQFEDVIQKYFLQFYGRKKSKDLFKIIFTLDVDKNAYLLLVASQDDTKSINVSWSTGVDKIFEDIIAKAKEVIGNRSSLRLESESERFYFEVMNNRSVWQDMIQMFFSDYSMHSTYFPAERVLDSSFGDYFPTALLNYFQSNPGLFNEASIIIMREFIEYVGLLKSAFRNHGGFDEMIANQVLANSEQDYSALKFVSQQTRKILKADYKITGDREMLLINDDEQSVELSISEASTGQQEVLRILQDIILVLSNRMVVTHRVIEEPEAHLFPSAQKYLIELFVLLVNETGSQLFITTHSPYVLSVLSNLLYAKKVCSLGAATAGEIEERTEMNRKTWLDKNQFAAYAMDSGKAKSIFDRESTGLIDQNYLDQVSEDLGREFQVLHNLRLAQIRKEKQI
jgi:predicted ATPase